MSLSIARSPQKRWSRVDVLRSFVRKLAELRALPPPVRRFYARALLTAARRGDGFALWAATPPGDLAELLRLVKGRRSVAELGTAHAWTSVALALADPERRVRSYHLHVWETRSTYLALASEDVRARLTLVAASATDSPATGDLDAVFVDASHRRESVLACFAAWRDSLRPGGLMLFHDFGNPRFPGVARAVEELGLVGERRRSIFVWPKPAA